jgi:rubrerythrin
MEFSAVDLLGIAEKIERNGSCFYRRAAGLCDEPRLSKLFVDLAQWESRHVEVFAQIRRRLQRAVGEETSDETSEPPRDVQLAALAVFGVRPDPADELSGHESRADVLRMAIAKEKDSITFYRGLGTVVADDEQRKLIDAIVDEENKHVRILTQSLGQAS